MKVHFSSCTTPKLPQLIVQLNLKTPWGLSLVCFLYDWGQILCATVYFVRLHSHVPKRYPAMKLRPGESRITFGDLSVQN